MKRWLPAPLLSLFLLLLWLLLNQSLSAGTWVIGGVLAVAAPRFAGALLPSERVKIHRSWLFAKLLVWALFEIVRSCLTTCLIIAWPRPRDLNSQFIRVPLDMRSPHGLAVLAALINSTPGTVWIEILPESRDLSLHVLDLHDAQWWIDTIKTRYEQPLMQIFEPAQGDRA